MSENLKSGPRRWTINQFIEQYQAGDPEALEFWAEWIQELNRLYSSIPPDLIRFFKQDESRRDTNDWYLNILQDMLDEMPIDDIMPKIKLRIDDYLIQSGEVTVKEQMSHQKRGPTKKRLERIARIKQIRAEDPSISIDQLALKFGISEKQIDRDLKLIRDN